VKDCSGLEGGVTEVVIVWPCFIAMDSHPRSTALDDSREGYVLRYPPSNYKPDGSLHNVQLRICGRA